MNLTTRQKEVLQGLRDGRKMTFTHYIGDTRNAWWCDEPWTPGRKNWSVVVSALLKKSLVRLQEEKTFHVFSVELTEAGRNA